MVWPVTRPLGVLYQGLQPAARHWHEGEHQREPCGGWPRRGLAAGGRGEVGSEVSPWRYSRCPDRLV